MICVCLSKKFKQNPKSKIMKKLFTLSMSLALTCSFAQKMFIVKSDEKFGIINESGIEIVPPKYTSIEEFDKMHVNWAKIEVNSLYGFVDKSGKIVVEPKYQTVESFDAYNSGWALVVKDGKYGFMNEAGLKK